MRKHPLIALTAFTALTASAVAGASSGAFESSSLLTGAQTHERPGHARTAGATSLAFGAELAYTLPPIGPDMSLVHDPTRPPGLRLNNRTGLPVASERPGVHRTAISTLSQATAIPAAPAVTTTTAAPAAPVVTTTTAAPAAPAVTTTTAAPEVVAAPAQVAAPALPASPKKPTPLSVISGAPPAPAGGVWYELRMCESGGNYAENSGNGYYGAYQFALSTWYGLGFSGLPSDAPPVTQDRAAQELQAISGWGQWPSCSVQLGL